MARAFIYDNIGLIDATLTEGSYVVNGGTNFVPGNDLVNHERAVDQSTGLPVTGWAQNEMLRIDLGASPGTPDRFCVLFNVTENDNLSVFAGNDATDLTVSTQVLSVISQFVANVWNVSTLSADDYRYYFIRSTSAGGLVGLCEILIGKIYSFEREIAPRGSDGEQWGVDVLTGYAGLEFANKRHGPKTHWLDNWIGLTPAMVTNLKAVRDDIGGPWKKFVFYDGSSYHWVRMTPESLVFTNEAGKVSYSSPIGLIKQLQ